MSNEGIDMMADQLKAKAPLNWDRFDRKYKDRDLGLSDAPLQLLEILNLVVKSPEKSVHIDAVIEKLDKMLDDPRYNYSELTDISDRAEDLIKFVSTNQNFATDEQKDAINRLYSKAVEARRTSTQLKSA